MHPQALVVGHDIVNALITSATRSARVPLLLTPRDVRYWRVALTVKMTSFLYYLEYTSSIFSTLFGSFANGHQATIFLAHRRWWLHFTQQAASHSLRTEQSRFLSTCTRATQSVQRSVIERETEKKQTCILVFWRNL